MASKSDLVIGFDLGGTKMLAAVMDRDYKILGRSKKRTRAERGAKECFGRIVATIDGALNDAGVDRKDIAGVGMGSPGPLDPWKGVIIDTPNLGFKNFALKAELEKELKVPVAVDNDVTMGTYGEFHFGAAKGCRHVVGIFPGTGIGGGLVLDGKIFRGLTGCAGEIGHMILDVDGPLCGCGQYGCVESLASRVAVAKEAAAVASRAGSPTIVQKAGTDLSRIKSGLIADALKADEPEITRLVMRSAWYLGVAMANIVNVLSPEMIVIGGGLVEAIGEPYVKAADKSMREHALPFLVRPVKVAEATLGDDAVIMGAARLIRDHLEEK
jgi:glucokinase